MRLGGRDDAFCIAWLWHDMVGHLLWSWAWDLYFCITTQPTLKGQGSLDIVGIVLA
jgi:hypothetical protein